MPTFFTTGREFERWLAKHHHKESLLVVGFYTVASGKPSMRFPKALDAALAYGWIDGIRHRVVADIYTVRFTPRKKDSFWSATNTRRALELIKERRMKPADLAAFKRRDEDRALYALDRQREAGIDTHAAAGRCARALPRWQTHRAVSSVPAMMGVQRFAPSHLIQP